MEWSLYSRNIVYNFYEFQNELCKICQKLSAYIFYEFQNEVFKICQKLSASKNSVQHMQYAHH